MPAMKSLILALFFALAAALPVPPVTADAPKAPVLMLADADDSLDCVEDGEGGWSCKESIPHSAPAKSGLTG